MTEDDVVDILSWLSAQRISVVVDGGWGVDALLGTQTRPHTDLDLAVSADDVAELRALLSAHGFDEIERDDSSEHNFVLADARGREVDVHAYLIRDGVLLGGVAYPPESLCGTGTIDGMAVRCITPEWAVRFHSGYELDADDYADVSALCERFSIPLPAEYERFTR